MTIVAEPPVEAHPDEAPVIAPPRRRWLADAGWASLALVLVVGVYVLLYARNGRFFYWDDVQHAYTGMSSAIGRELRDGNWPLDFRGSWLYSMLPSDPQFGLFHPFQLLVHVFVSTQEDLARTAFLVATAYAAIATGGSYCAARAARCRPVFAAGAAVAIGLNIHTLYYLSPSWQTHAAAVAWFTWFIAALLLVRRKPVLGPLAIIPTYLFMTSGYPHAAAAGVVVAAVLLGRDLLRRARPAPRMGPDGVGPRRRCTSRVTAVVAGPRLRAVRRAPERAGNGEQRRLHRSCRVVPAVVLPVRPTVHDQLRRQRLHGPADHVLHLDHPCCRRAVRRHTSTPGGAHRSRHRGRRAVPRDDGTGGLGSDPLAVPIHAVRGDDGRPRGDRDHRPRQPSAASPGR